MTPCSVDSTFLGDVAQLYVFAFNENDVLVSTTSQKNVPLNKEYRLFIPITQHGIYSFIAWSGIRTDKFDMQSLVIGQTTKKDLLFKIRQSSDNTADINGVKIYMGQSHYVKMPDPKEVGSFYEYVSLNLLEITNRLHVNVEGLSNPDDYQVEVGSGNGSYTIEGNVLKGSQISYMGNSKSENGVLLSSFTMLKLITDPQSYLIIRDKRNGKILIQEKDILNALILKSANVNMDCDNDFSVRFVINNDNTGTHLSFSVYVNNWHIHSYGVDLQ